MGPGTMVLIKEDNKKPLKKAIREYHENSNHSRAEETLTHLKRTVYFPHMKPLIAKTVRNVRQEAAKNDVCQLYI